MSKQRAFANKEREAQAKRLSRLARASLMALATCLSFAAITLVVVDQLYQPDTFVIDQLKIKGKFRYLNPVDVEAVIGTDALTNFFSVELGDVKRRVESLPWVQHADVRREWPNTLQVNVREHIPVMRWNEDKWVTSTGKVIDLPGDIQLSNAIVLSGNESDAGLVLSHAFGWKKRLLADGLELRKVHLSASRAWRLDLYHVANDTSFELILGREKTQERLARFQLLFGQEFRHSNQLLQRVDARYPDGLAIRMSPLAERDDTLEAAQFESSSAISLQSVAALTALGGNQR